MIEKIAYYLLSILAITIVCGTYIYTEISHDNTVAENVRFAIEKGIDPIAVRCAYASTWKQDNICIVYVSNKDNDVDAPVIEKKGK